MAQAWTVEQVKDWFDALSGGQEISARKRQRRRAALLMVAAILLYLVFFGNQGLIALGSTWHDRWALKQEIASLEQENQALLAQQDALRHDHSYYEKVAREKLLLKKPGELIYRFDGT